MSVESEKSNLLKDALKLVNQLANNDLADVDGDITLDDFDWEELQRLIIKARSLKKNKWWDIPNVRIV